jgi:NAD(P)-dependent dehydrogenase (short-subunit alcohol dehydrogenase family)
VSGEWAAFTNMVVVITGGTSGIGLAAARRFVSDDALQALNSPSTAAALNFNRRHQGGASTLRRVRATPPACFSTMSPIGRYC